MRLHIRVINVLDKMSNMFDKQVRVVVEYSQGEWMIKFIAGQAVVLTSLETFIAQPKIVVEPFEDELFKRYL